MTYVIIIALILSIIGSILVASNNKHKRFIGFLMWIIANILWINDAFIRRDSYQSILWIFYLLTAMLGLYNNK